MSKLSVREWRVKLVPKNGGAPRYAMTGRHFIREQARRWVRGFKASHSGQYDYISVVRVRVTEE